MIPPDGPLAVTYLSMDPISSTVGSSQVLAYVERMARLGLAIKLISFEHHVDTRLEGQLADLGVTWLPQRYGRRGTFGALRRVVRSAYLLRGSALVHARSDMAAAAAMAAGVRTWVWDVRSLWADQKVATAVIRSGSLQERVLLWIEGHAARRSAAAVVLTESAITALDSRYDGVVGAKARVITTCTDLNLFSVTPMPRGPVRLLLAGTINLFYDLPTMLEIVDEFRRRRSVEFIVASPEHTAWEEELSNIEVTRVSVSPAEMPDLIASSHLGLSICRDDAGISLQAAMPTKIGEFLACGRPVVVNSGLVDAARIVNTSFCGSVYGSSGPRPVEKVVDELEGQLLDSETPERCRVVAEAYFDLDRAVEELVGLYGSVSME